MTRLVRSGRVVAAASAVLLLAATAAAAPASAPTVAHLSFVGVKHVDVSQLRSLMETRASSWLPWGHQSPFDQAAFETDLQRIRAYYIDHGYPNVKVTSRIVHHPALNTVDLTVVVDEGQPVVVRSIDLEGFGAIPDARLRALRRTIPVRLGQPIAREDVVASQAMAVHELQDAGYAYGEVAVTAARIGPMDVALTFTATPGPLCYFGPIDISGNKSVSNTVILREVLYRPGERYNRALVDATQRKLYALGLFQFVEVSAVKASPPEARVPTRITVTEGRHHHVQFGFGWGTEEKVLLEAQWRQANFLGGARTGDVTARWSSIERGLRLDFTQPYVFSSRYALRAQGQRWYTYAPAYSLVASGGTVTLTHQVQPQNLWSVSLTDEQDTSRIAGDALNDPLLRNDLIALGLNPVTGQQSGARVAIGLTVQRNTAGSLLNATHGYFASGEVEQSGEWLPGAFNYVLVTGELRHYLSLGAGVVLADRVQAGDIEPQGGRSANIPFSKRFLLGGATSIRGWGRYEVSPLSESGLPIGGDSMFLASAELRVPLVAKLGGVVFTDLGNVWANPAAISSADLRYAVGAGLRYQTPVGPIRFDWGYQLNPIPGLLVNGAPQTRRWRLHFSIGQAF